MIFEEEEKNNTYINENGNNNDLLYNETYQKVSLISPTQDKVLIKKPFTRQSCHSTTEKTYTPNQLPKPKNEQYNGDLDIKNNIEKITTSAINDSIVSPVIEVKTATPCTRCAEISNIVQDFDEESNARANIKRLKKLIASRREDFFFGSDVLSTSFAYSSK